MGGRGWVQMKRDWSLTVGARQSTVVLLKFSFRKQKYNPGNTVYSQVTILPKWIRYLKQLSRKL